MELQGGCTRRSGKREKMTKISLVSLACATALALCPTALVGQSYNFDFSSAGNTITISSIFTVSSSQNADNSPYDSYTITSFTGTFTDTSDGVNGAISLVPLQAGKDSIGNYSSLEINDGNVYTYDNQFYPNGSPDAAPTVFENEILDNAVLLELTASGTPGPEPGGPPPNYYVFLYGDSNGSGDYEAIEGAPLGYDQPDGYENQLLLPASGITLAVVPEYGSLPMLALSIFSLAGGFVLRATQEGRFLNA
jgi:hypothetical protein